MGLTWREIQSIFTVVPHSAEVYICDPRLGLLRRGRCAGVTITTSDLTEIVVASASCPIPHPNLTWGEFLQVGEGRPSEEEPRISLDGITAFSIHGVRTDSALAIAKKVLLATAPFPDGPEVSEENPLAVGPTVNPTLN
jgi:hypothetical protein